MNDYRTAPWPENAPAVPPPAKRRGLPMKLSLVGGGITIGAVLAGGMVANAATPSPSSSTTAAAPSASSSTTTPTTTPGKGTGAKALPMTGTVTAVGASSVDIKDTAGTVTTYQVTTTSDIDKNGEAALSDLAVGDTVTFSATNGTIDKLHTGDETKNKPAAPTTAATPTASAAA